MPLSDGALSPSRRSPGDDSGSTETRRQVDITLLVPERTTLGSKVTWPSFCPRTGSPQSWGVGSVLLHQNPVWCHQTPSPTKVSPTSRGCPDSTWQLPTEHVSGLLGTNSNPGPRTAHVQPEEEGREEERSSPRVGSRELEFQPDSTAIC